MMYIFKIEYSGKNQLYDTHPEDRYYIKESDAREEAELWKNSDYTHASIKPIVVIE